MRLEKVCPVDLAEFTALLASARVGRFPYWRPRVLTRGAEADAVEMGQENMGVRLAPIG
jgi:hypothetical protein